MPDARKIPILNLKPDQELSADQIVQMAGGELRVLTDDGEDVGIVLQRKDRLLLHDAIALGSLRCSGKQTRLGEVFFRWCDAKKIPCVSFEVEDDCLDMMSTDDSVEKGDPIVTLHFNVVSAGKPFTKGGLVAVTEFLLGRLWNLALSPWRISAGILPLSDARQILADVYKIWETTSEPESENASASQTVQ